MLLPSPPRLGHFVSSCPNSAAEVPWRSSMRAGERVVGLTFWESQIWSWNILKSFDTYCKCQVCKVLLQGGVDTKLVSWTWKSPNWPSQRRSQTLWLQHICRACHVTKVLHFWVRRKRHPSNGGHLQIKAVRATRVINVHVYIYTVAVYKYIYIHMYVNIYIYTHHICVYVYMYIYIHVRATSSQSYLLATWRMNWVSCQCSATMMKIIVKIRLATKPGGFQQPPPQQFQQPPPQQFQQPPPQQFQQPPPQQGGADVVKSDLEFW